MKKYVSKNSTCLEIQKTQATRTMRSFIGSSLLNSWHWKEYPFHQPAAPNS